MQSQQLVRNLGAVKRGLNLSAASTSQRSSASARRALRTTRLLPVAAAADQEAGTMAAVGAEEKKEPGHQVPAGAAVSQEAVDPEILAYQQHQATAARLSLAEEARTLVAFGKFGVLSTQGRGEIEGFPSGSVVEYATDAQGRPLFAFSSLSPHTGDVKKDGRCSFTVMADPFRGIADGRVNVVGQAVALVSEEEKAAAREAYLARHPNSFWVNFGDFNWFRLDDIVLARVVAGFARAGKVTAAEYAAAEPDPIYQFSAPVAGHMNEDHADATVAMIKHYVGITVNKATILSLDRLGMSVACERGKDAFKCRLPFPRPATDRKSVKELIVEMTRAAAAAAQAAQ